MNVDMNNNNFTTKSKVNYFKYCGIFLKICGLLSVSNRPVPFITSIQCILIASTSIHFGIFVYLEYSTMVLPDIIEYSHLSQLFFLLFTILAFMHIKKKNLIDIYLSTLKGLYRYPWGNWTDEINIRSEAEKGIKLFYLIFPLSATSGTIQQIVRHANDPSRQPNDSLFKGWVPIPLDSRIVTVYQILVTLTACLVGTSYFTYIATVIERLTSEIEILKSILRDPFYVAVNTDYTVEQILKSCVQHQQIIYKYADLIFNVLNLSLLSLFVNGTLLLCTMGLLVTDNSLSLGTKVAIGLICTSELVAAVFVCHYGQKIHDSSHDLCFSIYQMKWYDLKPEERKMIITIMIRSQRGLYLTGGGIKIFNFETLGEILTTAYSYMGMLRAVRQT